MPALSQFLGLLAASVVLVVVPGPSVLFVIGRALSHGRRVALASVLGNAGGALLVAVVVSAGLGALISSSTLLLLAIRLTGAAYLVWLGIKAWRHAGDVPAAAGSAPPGTRRAIVAGVTVGVTNPKMYILFSAVLTQFLDPAVGSLVPQLLILSLVPVAVGLVTDSIWALVASTARGWFARSPPRLVATLRLGAACLVGLGVSVAVTGISP